VYLEDLFVARAARGKGVGRRLMTRLAAIAVERGWERIDLQVLDWNSARDFYRRLGMSISGSGCATAGMRLRSAALPLRICPTGIDPSRLPRPAIIRSPQNALQRGLSAGGSRIRTLGPSISSAAITGAVLDLKADRPNPG